MNVDDLLKEMHKDLLNDAKVIYFISGYYRNFRDLGFYRSFRWVDETDLVNEEIIENTKKFFSLVDKRYMARTNGSVWLPVQFSNNPYVITFYNNCIYAGQLGVTDMPFILADVKAYYVCKNGEVYSQMDTETGMINATYIDSLSDKLSEDFSKLIDIKLEVETIEEESL